MQQIRDTEQFILYVVIVVHQRGLHPAMLLLYFCSNIKTVIEPTIIMAKSWEQNKGRLKNQSSVADKLSEKLNLKQQNAFCANFFIQLRNKPMLIFKASLRISCTEETKPERGDLFARRRIYWSS